MTEPYQIPLGIKYGLYALSGGLIYGLYKKYDIGNLDIMGNFDYLNIDLGFRKQNAATIKNLMLDDLFNKKGARKIRMGLGEHISGKNGFGDYLKNDTANTRLRIISNGWLRVIKGDGSNLGYDVATDKASVERLLLLEENGDLVYYSRIGFDANSIGTWEGSIFIKDIDTLKVEDNGDLTAYKGGVLVWKNGVEYSKPEDPTCEYLEEKSKYEGFINKVEIKDVEYKEIKNDPEPNQEIFKDSINYDFEIIEKPIYNFSN